LKITGCAEIDAVIKPGTSTLFYGEAGVGKTRLLLTIAGNVCSLPSVKCLYISTEETLFYEIVARNVERYDRVLFAHITDFHELLDYAATFPQFVELNAIFVDSINAPYRLVSFSENSITSFGLLLALLNNIVVRRKAFLFASAQVRAGFHEDEEEVTASGMPILEFWFDNIFRVGEDEKGRFVEARKPVKNLKKYFVITAGGVEWVDSGSF